MSNNDYSDLYAAYADLKASVPPSAFTQLKRFDDCFHEAITTLQRQLAEANELLRRVSELLGGRWLLNSYGDCEYCGEHWRTGHNCELAKIEMAIDAALTEGGE